MDDDLSPQEQVERLLVEGKNDDARRVVASEVGSLWAEGASGVGCGRQR